MLFHVKVVHTLEYKRIVCSECGGKYQSKTSFEHHLKLYCEQKQTKQREKDKQGKETEEQEDEETQE